MARANSILPGRWLPPLLLILLLAACAAPNPWPDQYPTTHEDTIELGQGDGDSFDELFVAHNWTFQVAAAQRVSILVRSDGQSDPMLELYDAELTLLAEDDDGGEGLNAFTSVELPAAGTYTIRITSNAPGRYSLLVEEAP